jgi:hypothetical protein
LGGSDQEHDLDDVSDHMADMEEGMDQATTRWVWVEDIACEA